MRTASLLEYETSKKVCIHEVCNGQFEFAMGACDTSQEISDDEQRRPRKGGPLSALIGCIYGCNCFDGCDPKKTNTITAHATTKKTTFCHCFQVNAANEVKLIMMLV
jgi:hypothetical protein